MKRKIIFLGVEGVLTIFSHSYKTKSDKVEPHLLKRLKYLIDETNSYIVLIGSIDKDELKTMVTEESYGLMDMIIDTVPNTIDEQGDFPETVVIKNKATGKYHLTEIGDRIDLWMKEYGEDVDDFKVITSQPFNEGISRYPTPIEGKDDTFIFQIQKEEGLSDIVVRRVINLLKEDNDT